MCFESTEIFKHETKQKVFIINIKTDDQNIDVFMIIFLWLTVEYNVDYTFNILKDEQISMSSNGDHMSDG